MVGLNRLSRHTTAFTSAGSTPYLRAAATMCLSWLSSRYVRQRWNETITAPRAMSTNSHGQRRLIASMRLEPSVAHEQFAGQLLDQLLHFEAEQRHRNSGRGQTLSAHHFVDCKLVAIVKEGVNSLFALRKRQRW